MALLRLWEGIRGIFIQMGPPPPPRGDGTRIALWVGEHYQCLIGAHWLLWFNKGQKWNCTVCNLQTIKCHSCRAAAASQLLCRTAAELDLLRSMWRRVRLPVFSSVERVDTLISCRSSSVSVWKRRMEEPSENAIHTPPPAHAVCATLIIGSGWTSNVCNGNNKKGKAEFFSSLFDFLACWTSGSSHMGSQDTVCVATSVKDLP